MSILPRTYFMLIYLLKSHLLFLLTEILTQRFTVKFLSLKSTNATDLFGNPGINLYFAS